MTVAPDLDQRERAELSDLLDDLGPDQPTLCEGWTTSAMAAHLVVRERQPLAMPGILVGGRFEATTERMMHRELERHGYHGTVERVRTGPPPGPLRFGPIRSRVNLIEMTVHHEDVRRANGMGPRTDIDDLQDNLWSKIKRLPRFAIRGVPSGVGIDVVRSDTGEKATLRKGERVATVTGEPMEILLWAYGRGDAAQVELGGASDELKDARFGI